MVMVRYTCNTGRNGKNKQYIGRNVKAKFGWSNGWCMGLLRSFCLLELGKIFHLPRIILGSDYSEFVNELWVNTSTSLEKSCLKKFRCLLAINLEMGFDYLGDIENAGIK